MPQKHSYFICSERAREKDSEVRREIESPFFSQWVVKRLISLIVITGFPVKEARFSKLQYIPNLLSNDIEGKIVYEYRL